MDMRQWLYFYGEIIKDFGFSLERDLESAVLLNTFLTKPDLLRLKDTIKDKDVNIYGAGPSLEKLDSIPKGINIAADGVCSFLLKKGVVPDIIVTDLDGDVKDILESDRRGSVIILHAHGDNVERVRLHAKEFRTLYGTTQAMPFGYLLNYGGFTDGDRAGFIAEHFKPKKITFYGMDFHSPPGRYSYTKQGDIGRKMKKLKWAERLVQVLIESSPVEIVFA